MAEHERDLFDDDKMQRDRFRRTVSFAISSIKSSIERGIPSRVLDNDPELEAEWKRAVLRVESIRVDYSRARPSLPDRFKLAIATVHDGFTALLDDRGFVEFTSSLPYRPLGVTQRDQDELDLRVFGRGETVPDLIATLVEITREHGQQSGRGVTDIASLRRIIPPQKIAPVRFDVANGKLVVVNQPASALAEDIDNISASREALIERGEEILQALEQSNCDRRLVQSVRDLQAGLASGQNIIQLGLCNLTCEAVCGAFRAELPDALCGKLQGHTRGVAMYLAQFPDWQRFSEKAATVELDDDDIARISATALKLVTDLEARPEVADPEVPRTIAVLRDAIADPTRTTKRAAFAVLRTIENLVAKAIEYGAELIDSTITKSIADLSTVASKVIVVGLLSVALAGATGLAPIAGKISDTAWLRSVVEVVRNQIAAASN